MNDIIDPITSSDVETYTPSFAPAYASAEQGLAELRAMGRHLEAAAGHASHGAWWASAVAQVKRSTVLTCYET